MKSITLRTSLEIAAPAADVWDLVSVYAHDPRWRRGVSRMDQSPPGPVVDGARTVEELRLLGRSLTNTAYVSDVRPGSSFTWRVSGEIEAYGSRRVQPMGPDRCTLVIEKVVHLAQRDRLLRPIVALVLYRTELGDARRAARLVKQRLAQRTPADGSAGLRDGTQ